MSIPGRSLALRTAPQPGEALDSWLDANAARHHVSTTDLLTLIGLAPPWTDLGRRLCTRLRPAEADIISAATGQPSGTIAAMTLTRYGHTDTRVDAAGGSVVATLPWGHIHRARFCPHCLGATGGAWQLSWRLIWTFACPTHHCLLAEACPHCGHAQRRSRRIPSHVPQPGQCDNPEPGAAGTRRPRCATDLAEAPVAVFDSGHPVLAAQHVITALLDGHDGAADFGVYRTHPIPVRDILVDIRVLGRAILSGAGRGSLDGTVAPDLAALYQAQWAANPADGQVRPPPPLSVLSSAAAVCAALPILQCPDIAAAAQALAGLARHVDRGSLEQCFAARGCYSGAASAVVTAIHLSAQGRRLDPIKQWHCRIGTAFPQRHRTDTALVARRAAHLPTVLWASWALRLCPPDIYLRAARGALSVAVLLVGNNLDVDDAAAMLGIRASRDALVTVWWRLTQNRCWAGIRAAVIRLADHLDTHGGPIDYQRRRRLDYTHLLPEDTWAQIAAAIGTPSARAGPVRRYLREQLSGTPEYGTPAAYLDPDYIGSLEMPRRLTPDLRAALDEHTRQFLNAAHLQSEPQRWAAPLHLLDDLELPGTGTDNIDLVELHRLIRGEHLRIGQAAQRLGVNAEAVCLALDEHPAPPNPHLGYRPPIGARRPSWLYVRVAAQLPRHRLERLYLDEHRSLRDIGALVGAPRVIISRLAHDYAIALRTRREPAIPLCDRHWLYTEHVVRGRSLAELARERGVPQSTVGTWARRHGIVVQAGACRTAENLATNVAIPAVLLPALVGREGWERLQRFAIAAEYPSYVVAAQHLHCSAAILGQQVALLGARLGQPLVVLAAGNKRPMALTNFGCTVQAAVRTLVAAGGPDSQPHNNAPHARDIASLAARRQTVHQDPLLGPRLPGPAYRKASQAFPPGRLAELYCRQHYTLRQLADLAGVSTHTITALARDHGIAIRQRRELSRCNIDADWLYTEYIVHQRPLAELAHEQGVSMTTICKQARLHNIPRNRPPWRTAAQLATNPAIPPLLLAALTGKGGWERLQHFAVLTEHRSYRAAAAHLHVHGGALTSQMQRLEHDLGEPLLVRTTHPPHTLTPFGTTVLVAIAELTAAGGP